MDDEFLILTSKITYNRYQVTYTDNQWAPQVYETEIIAESELQAMEIAIEEDEYDATVLHIHLIEEDVDA